MIKYPKYFFLTLFILVWSHFSFSQSNRVKKKCTVAVYKTADDLKNNHPIEGEKIVWGTHFTKQGTEDVLKLKQDGSVIKYFEGSIFGYTDQDCKLHLYKHIRKKTYAYIDVLYTNGIYLYSRTTRGKGSTTYFYFNKDIYSPLIDLSKSNLINEFKNFPVFVENIKKIKNDNKLIRKDKSKNEYLVIKLFDEYAK